MRNTTLMMLALLLMAIWSCKDDGGTPVINGEVSGKITDAETDQALAGVRIIVFESNSNTPIKSLTSGADGMYKTELLAGNYYLKLYNRNYEQIPPKGMSPLPFEVMAGNKVDKPYEMSPSAVQNGGYISGKVSEGTTAVAGALVVAENGGNAYSAVTDAAGAYYIYNMPAGSYTLKALIAGYSSTQQSVSVTANAETVQNLALTKGAAGSVNGTISFLASNAREVDIMLVHPLTKEPIPGMLAKSSKDYSIVNVPAGTYIARASFQNDDRVVDPDWILKNGEPVVTVNGTAITRDFSLTGSVLLSSPTNVAASTEPILVQSTTPIFTWTAYSSTSDYVLEVSDANGNVVWGGFGTNLIGPTKKVSIPSNRTSAVYNENNNASLPQLQRGKVYRWRVYASKDESKEVTGWKLISVSEDQMGLIRIAD